MKKEKKIFSIRKFTMGVGSVVIGSAMFLGFEAHEAYADEIPSEQNQLYSIHNENSIEENDVTPEQPEQTEQTEEPCDTPEQTEQTELPEQPEQPEQTEQTEEPCDTPEQTEQTELPEQP
ncbi:TPA: YSIRK-type signal peptide-containing protein, partial [Staphylococcus aureus]